MKLFGFGGSKKDPTAAADWGEKSSKHGPLFSRVSPGSARTTPRRYDRLADEGYGRNVIAHRAISLVAQSVASIPLILQRGGQRLETHPLLDLVTRPNIERQGVGLIRSLVSHYLISGNAYLLAVGPGPGRPPKELWSLRPDTVAILEGQAGEPAGYRQTVAGRTHDFAADTVWHWKTFHPLSDWYGMAPLEAAALSVDSHNQASQWNLALIQNGGAPSGVLYQEDGADPLTDAQFDRLKSDVESRHTGPLEAGRPMLLEGGLKWQDMGLSPKDMDWASGQSMSAREIAMAFGVPPQLIGLPDAQTYANFAEARMSLYEDTAIPLAREIVSELTSWLVPQYGEEGESLTFSLDLDDLPALEPKRAAKFDRLARADFLTLDEKRAALGYGPAENGLFE